MEFTGLMADLMIGAIGMGFILYGKNAGQLAPIGAGLGLAVVPYFISSLPVLLVVCGVLIAVPFFVRG